MYFFFVGDIVYTEEERFYLLTLFYATGDAMEMLGLSQQSKYFLDLAQRIRLNRIKADTLREIKTALVNGVFIDRFMEGEPAEVAAFCNLRTQTLLKTVALLKDDRACPSEPLPPADRPVFFPD